MTICVFPAGHAWRVLVGQCFCTLHTVHGTRCVPIHALCAICGRILAMAKELEGRPARICRDTGPGGTSYGNLGPFAGQLPTPHTHTSCSHLERRQNTDVLTEASPQTQRRATSLYTVVAQSYIAVRMALTNIHHLLRDQLLSPACHRHLVA